MRVGLLLPTAMRTIDLRMSVRVLGYAELRDIALTAEAVELDSIWVVDHLMFRRATGRVTGIWEAWTVLSALAAETKRVELGTLVICTAFRNPPLLAKMAVTLDEVSRGRLILGLGAGWHDPEFRSFGYETARKIDRFEEAVQIIGPLLRQGHATFQGRDYSAADARLAPRGPRPEGIPILIGAEKARMLTIAARHADSYNTAWYGLPDARLRERLQALKRACESVGRDPGSIDTTVGVKITVTGSQDSLPLASHEHLVDGLLQYADLGVSHVVCALWPTNRSNVKTLGEAVATVRSRLERMPPRGLARSLGVDPQQ